MKINIVSFTLLIVLLLWTFIINSSHTNATENIFETDYLEECSLSTNCALENWEIDNVNDRFLEIKDILKNTPRVRIIKSEEAYIKAIAISRILKFVDDIEVKKLKNQIIQVKSSSRFGIYDLGVNQRRLNTLHFRLIDIYDS